MEANQFNKEDFTRINDDKGDWWQENDQVEGTISQEWLLTLIVVLKRTIADVGKDFSNIRYILMEQTSTEATTTKK